MTTWTEAVLDDLYTGDKIRVTSRNGACAEGWYVGIDAARYAIVFDAPVPGFEGKAIGASVTVEVETQTRDIARIERAMCEGA